MLVGDNYYGQHNSHYDWLKIISGRSIKNFKVISAHHPYKWYGDPRVPKDDNYGPYF